MAKVIIPPARCQLNIGLIREGKATEIHLGTQDVLICWVDAPVALISGGVVYHHIDKPSSAITRLINSCCTHRPSVALAAADFDFVVGSVLTRVGLSLTRAPQEKP